MTITYKGPMEEKYSESGGVTTITRGLKFSVDFPSLARNLMLNEYIPQKLSFFPVEGYKHLRLKSRNPKLVEGDSLRGIWIVVLVYNDSIGDVASIITDNNLLPWEKNPYNISFGSRNYVVPHTMAYGYDSAGKYDKQGEPSVPVAHPVTKEPLEANKQTRNNTIFFTYNLEFFDYAWKREFEGTVNKSGIMMLSNPFPATTLVLRSLGVKKMVHVAIDGTEYDYYQIAVEMEDLNEPYKLEIPLIGMLMSSVYRRNPNVIDLGGYPASGGIVPVMIYNGVYGYWSNAVIAGMKAEAALAGMVFTPPKLISSPIYIDRAGKPVQPTSDIGDDSFTGNFPALYEKDWTTLDLPIDIIVEPKQVIFTPPKPIYEVL